MRLTHLTAKGLHGRLEFDQPIGPVTLIVGRNESGKSTLLRLPELAVAGPTGATFPVLGTSPDYDWSVAAFFDAGRAPVSVSRWMEGGKHQVVAPDPTARGVRRAQASIEATLGRASVWSSAAFLSMSPAKRLDWLAGTVLDGHELTLDEARAKVDAILDDEGAPVDVCAPRNATGRMYVTLALEAVRQAVKDTRAELTQLDRAVAEDDEHPLSSQGDVAAVRAELDEIDRRRAELQRKRGALQAAQARSKAAASAVADAEFALAAHDQVDTSARVEAAREALHVAADAMDAARVTRTTELALLDEARRAVHAAEAEVADAEARAAQADLARRDADAEEERRESEEVQLAMRRRTREIDALVAALDQAEKKHRDAVGALTIQAAQQRGRLDAARVLEPEIRTLVTASASLGAVPHLAGDVIRAVEPFRFLLCEVDGYGPDEAETQRRSVAVEQEQAAKAAVTQAEETLRAARAAHAEATEAEQTRLDAAKAARVEAAGLERAALRALVEGSRLRLRERRDALAKAESAAEKAADAFRRAEVAFERARAELNAAKEQHDSRAETRRGLVARLEAAKAEALACEEVDLGAVDKALEQLEEARAAAEQRLTSAQRCQAIARERADRVHRRDHARLRYEQLQVASRRVLQLRDQILRELVGPLLEDVERITRPVLDAGVRLADTDGFELELVRYGRANVAWEDARSASLVTAMALRLAVVNRLGGWRAVLLDDIESLDNQRLRRFLAAMVEEVRAGRLDNFIGALVVDETNAALLDHLPDGVTVCRLAPPGEEQAATTRALAHGVPA